MRLIKLFLVILLAVTLQGGWAQSEQLAMAQERDPAKSIHIFPNPAVDYIHVTLDDFPAENVKLTLHTIIGNEIEIEKEVVSEFELRIRVKDLSSGYYLLAVKDEESKFRGIYKFLKR